MLSQSRGDSEITLLLDDDLLVRTYLEGMQI